MKEFNVTGTCVPSRHYMVNIDDKLDQIVRYIDKGQYFTINRARQYGKTTTFASIDRRLHQQYHIAWISFENASEESFADNVTFVEYFIALVSDSLPFTTIDPELASGWQDITDFSGSNRTRPFEYLSKKVTELCKISDKDIILMIDEVDKICDNQIFLNFLGMLRNKYLFRESDRDITFKSVILAGVYDIKNLKLKLRSDAEKKYNSPWNIAADFNVDMSFSPEEIQTMLSEYEAEHNTGMDIKLISEQLYFYSGGYPFLVSRLCKWIDEESRGEWSVEGVRRAEKEILHIPCTLFDDLIKNYENNQGLHDMIDSILFEGKRYTYVHSDPVIQLGTMFGIFKRNDENVEITNVIFETLLYNHIMSRKERERLIETPERGHFIKNGKLNMPLVLERFQELLYSEYRREDEKFVEQQGRLLFLCFLKPIINGTGFYYVEPETRNNSRMDVVVAYGDEEHIVELKIWHGAKYRQEGIDQLEEYLDNRGRDIGYLISFSFLKERKQTCGWIAKNETSKQIFEIIV